MPLSCTRRMSFVLKPMGASMIRNGLAVATFLFAFVAFAQNERGTMLEMTHF